MDKKLVPYNPLEYEKIIENNSLDIVFCDMPIYNDKDDRVTYKWKNEDDYYQWFNFLITMIENKVRKQGFMVLILRDIIISILKILEEKEYILMDHYIIDKGKYKQKIEKKYYNFENVFIFGRDTKREVKTILKSCQKAKNLSSKDINQLLGVKSNGGGYWSLYTGENKNLQIPCLKHWEIFQELFELDIEYDDIISDYQSLEENMIKKLDYSNGRPTAFYNQFLQCTKRKNINVLDMFCGDGFSFLMTTKEINKLYCFEYNKKKYFKALINTGQTKKMKDFI